MREPLKCNYDWLKTGLEIVPGEQGLHTTLQRLFGETFCNSVHHVELRTQSIRKPIITYASLEGKDPIILYNPL